METLLKQRREAYEAAKVLLEKMKAGDVSVKAELARRVADVEDLDAKIASQRSADALIAAFGPGDGLGPGGASPSSQRGYLNLKSDRLAARAAATMLRVGASHYVKGIGPVGEALTGIELVSIDTVPLGRPLTQLVGVIPAERHHSPTFEYLVQTNRVINAAVVAPGATKPTSVLGVTKKQGTLQVVAHLCDPLDVYLVNDIETLAPFVGNELLYGLWLRVENEIVNGDGETGHLTGLINTSGVQTQGPLEDDPAPSRTIRAAITLLDVAGFEAKIVALSPQDWEAIESFRDGENTYELGGPVDTSKRQLWGVSVVTTQALTPGTALVMDPACARIDTDTDGVRVAWSENYGNDFASNQVRARCEGRFGLSVLQPAGVVVVDLVGGDAGDG
jgi:HK97 family phage major capsid protein